MAEVSAIAESAGCDTLLGESGPQGPRLLAGVAKVGEAISYEEHRRVYPPPPGVGRGSDEAIIRLVEQSGLRGRGGGAFPTGTKMRAVASGRRRPVVVVNGAEGEPASGKDKLLLSTTPHLVLDGALYAAAAVGAREVIVCVDRFATAARDGIERALIERDGRDPHAVPIRLAAIPPRYVAGEETALVHWLNGGPARPTLVPPRPFERGVGGRPTQINNVETLGHLTQIMRWGPEWFRRLGAEDEPGTALVTLSGMERAGVYEVPLGTPLRDVIATAGGTPQRIGGVLLGGYFGTWISADKALDARLSNGHLRPLGAALGCGAVAVLPASACGVLETARVITWLAAETAGQCGPCVHGLASIAGASRELVNPRRNVDRRGLLIRWADQVQGRGVCRMPDGATRFLRSALEVFADDYHRHVRGRPCGGAKGPGQLPIPAMEGEQIWR